MSAPAFSAAPWSIDFYEDDGRDDSLPIRANGRASHWVPIAYVPVDYTDRPEREANARLIAAAPDMYEALKDVTAFARKMLVANGTDAEFADVRLEKAISAIAKAEGR